ncbi:MAG: DUF444 family protein [Desulfohalobiaceae bacterium]|nr:DUF444 family protein [Desulfohalobiaceae bacterium]
MKPETDYQTNFRSLDELLERDKLREKDGFPRKIKVGRLVKPGRGDKTKVTVVPTTVEEKFYHDRIHDQEEGDQSGGSGQGEEGEVIGEQPLDESEAGGEGGAGEGEGGVHEMESDAYDLGKILTEKFELPNLKQKGKKKSLSHFTYDLTDKNRGAGQLLDKKSTLRRILQTNISLGRVRDRYNPETSGFLVGPKDKVYRILSREKTYESQALVFFLRDYSGSMWGKPTEMVVSQHVLIYSWLLYQYARQVETRFILHDTEAREVPDFYTYYNSRVAGGTRIVSSYRLVNRIIEEENLFKDYNIYIFHGSDGDDWDREGGQTLPELRKMLQTANRIGVTVIRNGRGGGSSSFENYLYHSGLVEENPDLLRVDRIREDADEKRLIQGIRYLTSEKAGA